MTRTESLLLDLLDIMGRQLAEYGHLMTEPQVSSRLESYRRLQIALTWLRDEP